MRALDVTRKIARMHKLASMGDMIANVAKRPELIGGAALGGIYGAKQGNENATQDQKTLGTIGGALAGAAGGAMIGGSLGSVARSIHGGDKGNLYSRIRDSRKALDEEAQAAGATGGAFKKWYKPYTTRVSDYANSTAPGATQGRLAQLKEDMSKITDDRTLTHAQQMAKVDELTNKSNLGKYTAARDEAIGNAWKLGLGVGMMGMPALASAKDVGAAPDSQAVASEIMAKSQAGHKLSGREKMLLRDKIDEMRANKNGQGSSAI
jgi:hypothetical protein